MGWFGGKRLNRKCNIFTPLPVPQKITEITIKFEPRINFLKI